MCIFVNLKEFIMKVILIDFAVINNPNNYKNGQYIYVYVCSLRFISAIIIITYSVSLSCLYLCEMSNYNLYVNIVIICIVKKKRYVCFSIYCEFKLYKICHTYYTVHKENNRAVRLNCYIY